MIIKVSDMPTNGYLTHRVSQIEINPLTFGELLKYLGDEQMSSSREYVRALKYLVSKDSSVAELSLLDADYLLYVFKAISGSREAKLVMTATCDHCGKKHSRTIRLNKIEFTDVNEAAMKIKSIKLSDTEIGIHYPTIGEFIDFFGYIDKFEGSRDIDVLKFICMLDMDPKESVKLIDNCVHEDIALINYLDTAWFKLVKPLIIKCPDNPDLRGTTAAFIMSAVDIFRSILLINTAIADKISIGEISEDTEH